MGENFTKKEQIVILLIILVVISLVGFKTMSKGILSTKPKPIDIGQTQEDDFFEREKLKENEENNQDNIEEIENTEIMVHISGQVYNPGLVEMKLGQRLKDAVEIAGGLKEDADLDKINLAKKLADEDKIYIPAQGEEGEIESLSQGGSPSDNSSDKIDINNCDKSQLQTLPGIGEVLAARIIEYRESTAFKKIEDLMNVSGIGEKKFQDIKDLVIIR